MGKRKKNKGVLSKTVNPVVAAEVVQASKQEDVSKASKLAALQRDCDAFAAKFGPGPHGTGLSSPFSENDRDRGAELLERGRALGVKDEDVVARMGVSKATVINWEIARRRGRNTKRSAARNVRERGLKYRAAVDRIFRELLPIAASIAERCSGTRASLEHSDRLRLSELMGEASKYSISNVVVAQYVGLSPSAASEIKKAAQRQPKVTLGNGVESEKASSRMLVLKLPNGTEVTGTADQVAALVAQI